MLKSLFRTIGATASAAVDTIVDVAEELSELPGALEEGYRDGFVDEMVKPPETAVSASTTETPAHNETTGEVHKATAPKEGPFQVTPQQ